MSNYHKGHNAEKQAAAYLRARGFKIYELNWRTRFCEIDIVAEKSKRIYFIEVKYRQRADWGIGLDYITPRKLQQMRFAATFWMATHRMLTDCQLAGLSIDGSDFRLELLDV